MTTALRFALPLLVLMAACGSPAESPPEIPVGLEIGNRAPALEGVAADSSNYTLRDIPEVTTVLVFYRSAVCGLCRVQLEQIQRHLPAYRQLGVGVVAITLDRPETSRQVADALGLEFPLISVDGEGFRAWGVIPEQGGPPLPATFIVDPQRVIRFRHIGRNGSDRASDVAILTELERLSR